MDRNLRQGNRLQVDHNKLRGQAAWRALAVGLGPGQNEFAKSSRRLCFGVLASLLFTCAALAVGPRREVYVIQSKPFSVAVIDADRGHVVDTIPLQPHGKKGEESKGTTEAITDSQGRFLYVLENGGVPPLRVRMAKAKPSRLVVVELATRRVARVIQLGIGVTKLQFSHDERTLFCFAVGNVMQATKRLKPRDAASIAAIDTATHDVRQVYRFDAPASDFVMTRDASRIFAFSSGHTRGRYGMGRLKIVSEQMTVLNGSLERPLATVDLENHLASIAFSADERLLFLLGEGRSAKGKAIGKAGRLDVVDVATGKLLRTQTVGDGPLRLLRLADEPGLWVVGEEEMQYLSENGVLASQRIVLNGNGSEPAGNLELHGYPGEAVLLPGQKMAVLVTKSYNRPTHRLALLDLADQRVARLVPVGRESVRAGKTAGKIGLAVGLSLASYGAFSAVGSPYAVGFIPALGGGHNEGLAKRDDGRYFYALDSASNDVTVVQSADGAVADHVPVDSSHYRLWIPKGGRYLYCLGGSRVTVIDTDTNKRRDEYKLDGDLIDSEADDNTSQLYLLTGEELEIWDGKTSEHIASIPGLKNPLTIARGNEVTR